MRRNPVVSLYQYDKYDPDNEGIGFCFGRAMFANMHLVAKGIERDHIKKAFVIGHMETPDGASWGWHVATIARTERVNAKNEIVEDWYVVDPIVGYPMYITDWYNYMRDDFSVDGKLRIWFSEPAKFGPSQNSFYTEQYMQHSSFNDYFVDMLKWFEDAYGAEGSIYDKKNWYTNYKPVVRKVIPMNMEE